MLTPANSNTNQNSYANSDSDCAKRAVFGPCCNPTQSIIADPSTDFDCLTAQTGRLIDCRTLATTETIYNVVQNGPDSVGDLVGRRRRACGCASAGASSNSA